MTCRLTSISALVISGMALFGADAPEARLRRTNKLIQNGSYEQARTELKILLREAEETGAAVLLLGTLNNLAAIELEMERYSEAERMYLRSWQVWAQLPPAKRAAEPDPHFSLLSLYVQAGWLRKAEQVAARLKPAADREQQIRFLEGLGRLRYAQKRFGESIQAYRQALELAKAVGEEGTVGTLWNSVGVSFAGERKWNEAADAFERALIHNEAAWGEHPVLVANLTNLGAICLEQNRTERAASALGRARELAERTLGTSYPGLYRILILQAKAFERGKQPAEAKAARRQAQAVWVSLEGRHRIDINDISLR